MSKSPLILYVETNFLISIATGRDPGASALLDEIGLPHRLALPQICIMEALSVLNGMRRRRNQFRNQLDQQIGEMRRDSTSAYATELLSLLDQARIANKKLLEDIDTRLFTTIRRLGHDAELIGLNEEIVEAQLNSTLLDDPTDNLILHCILNHAREHPTEEKVFLTGDREAFSDQEVQSELSNVGVSKLFWEGKRFRDWFVSQRQS